MSSAVVICHYHEVALKQRNREIFEKKLRTNIAFMLSDIVKQNMVMRGYGRLKIVLPFGFEETEKVEIVKSRLSNVFGLTNFGIGVVTALDIEKICEASLKVLKNKTFKTFSVKTKRQNKRFPLNSVEVNRQVGAYLLEEFKNEGKEVSVDLKNPDVSVHIEIVDKEVYVYADRFKGPGGLPVGSSGKVVSLLSAGFDSPIASYMMMKRGAKVIFVHYHSYPYTSYDSIEQVKQLVKILTKFQFHSKLFIVPIAEAQRIIVLNAPVGLRTILYRRLMIKIAEKIAEKEGAEALVTGESLGQVASQTLRNIRVINQIATFPILRPLIGIDKEEIIQKAREIGTYEISSQPYDDCCSFLTGRHPETWADFDEIFEVEKKLNWDELVDMSLSNAEIENVYAEFLNKDILEKIED
ncbi:tRNA uracil 4-sulfurtransferase ThiI [Candidatus Chrysopegis kryptomonas]|jgi:thiamine biosynthesis protein ThiI|uniref:Probable tRNA sulfurtransferase n=1 Tax=Candidatus Chryseopegocella kryptomonas TaxID=1633643 RepID=A0A0P1MV39_9BACT|nr:tRNA uracil 4-sulfurtransferase ThiI [Candidatus Chrysopegis kryptomonas]CUS99898.1 thiamine biosynthesis protein ThiI [Candidatus Chrysopegis kryptomonas]